MYVWMYVCMYYMCTYTYTYTCIYIYKLQTLAKRIIEPCRFVAGKHTTFPGVELCGTTVDAPNHDGFARPA